MKNRKRTLSFGGGLQENWPPKWFFSYADVAVLLMTFFMILATMLALNIPVYVLADKKIQIIQRMKEMELMVKRLNTEERRILRQLEELETDYAYAVLELDKLESIYKKIYKYINNKGLDKLLKIKKERWRIEIVPVSPILFEKGQTKLSSEAKELLDEVGKFIKSIPSTIFLEGRADGSEKTRRYRSSWELSCARANKVGLYLMNKYKIPVEKVNMKGLGEYRPLLSNNKPENSRLNRSVTFKIIPLAKEK